MCNYYFNRIKELFGGKIVGAITVDVDIKTGKQTIKTMMPDSKYSACEEGFMGLLIKMPDKSMKGMIIMQDEEGNGPGDFDIFNLQRFFVLDQRSKSGNASKEIGENAINGKKTRKN